jgi:hypothetical protein
LLVYELPYRNPPRSRLVIDPPPAFAPHDIHCVTLTPYTVLGKGEFHTEAKVVPAEIVAVVENLARPRSYRGSGPGEKEETPSGYYAPAGVSRSGDALGLWTGAERRLIGVATVGNR